MYFGIKTKYVAIIIVVEVAYGGLFNAYMLNIFAVRNHASSNMETGISEKKPPLIGLFTIGKKLNGCQVQSRFAERKPALYL